jgi:hypothetical protein
MFFFYLGLLREEGFLLLSFHDLLLDQLLWLFLSDDRRPSIKKSSYTL